MPIERPLPDSPLATAPAWRRLPVGAELAPAGGAHFRVWAPKRRSVAVVESQSGAVTPLDAEGDGYHSGMVEEVAAGALYRYRLDDGESFPDPASRFQPEGPAGPSMLVDPTRFRWSDAAWRGVPADGRVIYEMHVGTFTREGTWQAAMRELAPLAELGVTLLEVMPVHEFAGRFGWGYDGADLFAPTHLYGAPDDFRAFVDRAHALGLGVILDVVYNHFGPDGCYLRQFADEYFSTRHSTDWGEAINFDGERSAPVREFFRANAHYWTEEFHLDGLRIDAAQSIHDESSPHILQEIAAETRRAAPNRTTFIVAEHEPQDARLVRDGAVGGLGLDALWNDDWHHSAIVAATGRDEAYYADYRGTAAELVAAAKHGFLYQGQWYSWQRQPRGVPARDLAPGQFVHYLQNHDQVANSFRGQRLHESTSPPMLRALTTLLLLGPQTPMLLQGQEFAATTPFLYFADHRPELAVLVREGRRTFLAQFQSLADPAIASALTDPADQATFDRSKLDPAERNGRPEVRALHRDLLALRRHDGVVGRGTGVQMDGAVLAARAFLLRFIGEKSERLLLVNLGHALHLDVMPEPLLAPPEGAHWAVRFSSEDQRYGGVGTPALAPAMAGWTLPGGCAVLMAPEPGAAEAASERDAAGE